MKCVSICVLGLFVANVFAGPILLDHDFTPSAVDMEMLGEEMQSGKSWMVAGKKVLARVTIDNYSPEWTHWIKLVGNSGVGGRFRHKFEGFVIRGYPAAEIEDAVVDIGYSSDGPVKAMGSRFREVNGSRCLTSAAANMIMFEVNVNQVKRDPLYGSPKIECPQPFPCKDGEYRYLVELSFNLPKGRGWHGQYYWTADTYFTHEYETYTYCANGTVITNGPYSQYAWLSPHPESSWYDVRSTLLLTNEHARVFFAKDEKDDGANGNPNWFNYWAEDGAVPQLSSVCFAKVPTYDRLFTIGNENDLYFGGVHGDDYGNYDPNTGKIELYEKAGGGHYFAGRSTMPITHDGCLYEFADKTIYGIYTVENVVAHESMHKKLNEEYLIEKNAAIAGLVDVGEKYDKWLEIDSDIKFEYSISDRFKLGFYTGAIHKELEHVCCDSLTNDMEAKYKMDKDALDKYQLGTPGTPAYKAPVYRTYGDNEFLAMLAGWKANNESSQVNPNADWSFPGQQSYIPWPFVKRTKTVTSTYTAKRSLQTACVEYGGLDLKETNGSELLCTALVPNMSTPCVGSKCNGVEYQFNFTVIGTNKVEILGYLSDLDSNVVARAMIRKEFTPMDDMCTLFFDGVEIYNSGKNGPYMLLGLVLREYDDDNVYFHSAVSGFCIPNIDAKYDDFLRANVQIIKESVVESEDENGITFGIDVEAQLSGTTELIASVATTNGVFLGQYEESLMCAVGTNHYTITIPAEAIRTFAQNGPYVITKAVAQREQVIIDQVDNLYTTQMEDFATYYGFGSDEPEEPGDPDAPLSQKIGEYTWYYSVLGEGAVIQKIVDYGFISWGECAVEPTPTGDIELPSVLGGKKVVAIGESAFEDCSDMTSVAIPSSVTNISKWAFYDCSSLTNLTFVGDAPNVENYAISGVDYWCTVTVYDDATGWDEDEDGYWNDMEIIYRKRGTPSDGPSVSDDPGATVVGDATSGYTITPSAGKTDVEVTIPFGVAADKVTVEVGTDVVRIKPNGATVKIKRGADDITSYLVLPVADSSGAIDLSKAAVKAEVVKETLDPTKGAVIMLNATSPTLTTSETKPGLTYTLKEGATIKDMDNGDSKVGDGKSWTPNITVKGGTSGFYSIGVTK